MLLYFLNYFSLLLYLLNYQAFIFRRPNQEGAAASLCVPYYSARTLFPEKRKAKKEGGGLNESGSAAI